MRIELLNEAAKRAHPLLLDQLITFTRYPTERNSCYLTGYVGAMEAYGHISRDDASYWRAFTGHFEGHPEWAGQWTQVLKRAGEDRESALRDVTSRKAE